MKILLYDIETSPIVANTWNLYPTAISHESIIQDWFIICAAWKYLGEDKVHEAHITEVGNDYEVVRKLRDAIASADVVVHHNGDKFDIKKLNTRLIFHELPPLPTVPMVDTLKEIKKIAAFSSNRLDYLAKTLTGQGKMHVDYQLWLDVLKGSKKAVKTMVEYNKVDVITLENVYVRIKPYMKSHPHVGVLKGGDRKCTCNKCGSEKLKRNGIRITAMGIKKQELQCMSCGSYSRIPVED